MSVHRITLVRAAGLAAIAVLGLTLHGSTAARSGVSAGAAPDPVICEGAIQHPLHVQVKALDPVRRGESLRLRVTTTSARALTRGSVRMVSSGGAGRVGADRVDLRALPAGGSAEADFAVSIPQEGRQFLVQFKVRGEGDEGFATRGATYNVLPDGPADPGRLVTRVDGTKIREFRARRIDR